MNDLELLELLKRTHGEELTGDKPPLILYGSETGTAAALARSFQEELESRGLKPKCMAMDHYDVNDLENEEMVFMIVATCGQGELPSNCKYFAKDLLAANLNLEKVKFATFGLGDSSYVYYNEAAKIFDQRFTELGAKKVINLGLGNDKDDEKFETAWYEWLPEVTSELQYPEPPAELQPPKFTFQISTDYQKMPTWQPEGTKLIPLKHERTISPKEYERNVKHYEFDTKGLNMPYGSGDCLSIAAHNQEQDVHQFLDQIKINPNQMLTLTNQEKVDIPTKMSVGQLFTEVLDVFGRPSRRFYEFLSKVAKDQKEKAEIQFLLTKEGKDQMVKLIKETTTYADLLLKYPSAIPSLDYLAQYINPIKPRLYSIASHPDWVGDEIHLCIIADDWHTPTGKYKKGLCSNYLRGLNQGQSHIVGKLYPSSIELAPTQEPPILMIALGTGCAPMRALMQERDAARKAGEKVGPMTYVFGSRNKKNDFLYQDELENYMDNGLLENLITAFSRDQKEKIYVQHRLEENYDLIYNYLYKNRGYFYLCGIGGPEEAVKVTVKQAIQEKAELTDKQADEFMLNLAKEGRFNFETW